MFRNKIFIIIFLFCFTFLFAGPTRFPEKIDSNDRFGLSAEYLTSSKMRAADSLNCTLVGGWFTGPGYAVCIVDTLAYIGAGQSMKILNVKDSTNPVLVGEVILPFVLIFDIFIKDTLAYVANCEDGLRVINVSDPSSPFEIGFLDIFDHAYGVWVKDTLAYVTDGDRGLSIINVANPASMSEIGNCDTPSWAYDVWVQDTFAYVADRYGGLRIINVADPSLPGEVGFYDSLDFEAVYVRDTLVYAAGGGLCIINVAEPSLPVKVGFYGLDSSSYYVRDVWVQDSLAYLAVSSSLSDADSCRLQIVNIANSASISDVGNYFTPGRAVAVRVEENLAYVEYFAKYPDYLEGLLIVNISDLSTPLETSRYEMGGMNGSVWVQDSFAYVANHQRGLRIINIADLTLPKEIGWFDTPDWPTDVYIEDTLVYVTDGSNGLYIINVANPSSPGEVGYCNMPSNSGPWGVWAQDTFAYVADSDSGLRIIDVSEPSSPVEIGFYNTPGYAYNVWVQDTLAYLTVGIEDTLGDSGLLYIINVSDPSSPSEIISIPGEFNALFIKDTLAYVVGRGLRIIDISDPSSPAEVGSCGTPGEYDGGVWVQDNLACVANADSGLRIIDVSNPSSPSEVGFYNVYWELCANDVYVKDSLIYVAYDRLGLYIFKYTGLGGIEDRVIERDGFNITSISGVIEINYSVIAEEEKVKIEIFNILGQKVVCPVDRVQSRGHYTMNWNGKTGIYFVRMEMGRKIYRQKVLLLK
jgi:hypothetical protein